MTPEQERALRRAAPTLDQIGSHILDHVDVEAFSRMLAQRNNFFPEVSPVKARSRWRRRWAAIRDIACRVRDAWLVLIGRASIGED